MVHETLLCIMQHSRWDLLWDPGIFELFALWLTTFPELLRMPLY